MKSNYNFDAAKLGGPVCRFAGRFGNWQGTVTIRPDTEGPNRVENGYLSVTYSGTGSLPSDVKSMLLTMWVSMVAGDLAVV